MAIANALYMHCCACTCSNARIMHLLRRVHLQPVLPWTGKRNKTYFFPSVRFVVKLACYNSLHFRLRVNQGCVFHQRITASRRKGFSACSAFVLSGHAGVQAIFGDMFFMRIVFFAMLTRMRSGAHAVRTPT